MMMLELPEHLLEEILCRVPAMSLKRLGSTCKGWNRLFKDRRFTRMHLDKGPKQFLIHMSKGLRVRSMSVDLHRLPHVKVTAEFSLTNPQYPLDEEFEIHKVSHCDGLLLCVCITKEDNTRLVVWNPCTGQTRWIQRENCYDLYDNYSLGSYQDKRCNDNSYNILAHTGFGYDHKFQIYEINSNSWRIIDATFDFKLEYIGEGVSLKGKSTYWIVSGEKEKRLGIFLISFDYTTERFERLRLPNKYPCSATLSLSIVREEKLSMLSQRAIKSKPEIWVTNKIGETQVVSWTMVLAVYLQPGLCIWDGVSFWVDEKKKVVVCCDNLKDQGKTTKHIFGEDNKVKQVDFEVGSSLSCMFYYVPSLTQIYQGITGKRKRDE
ncbi:LOW QUALITY PROTEIN: probable F-box protein At5g47300 [Arabidopsis lyrata subsp. lyrata]|uniref:LOW QUALITY PROTEIN: probable F-box protein At5g47300 n=1 Tax=Arabidopsis lyrata subsp. lyrata TaxID=81972 RepID=UPI000A29E843|nr:LOW QUALITY PROTEIN: probable F-box protein At5g47300 [Arabidopsis lyrata subsp. lyrata]|eukprot:XP_020866895.1 LOW QUALITY PROTEIN: probable F-box protein At5g47300 [Arabidopsis lyrata subsp. lyrata]